MNSPSVLLTFSADKAQKRIFEENLPENVAVISLDEVNDTQRTTVIEQADQTLQLLSAGVDFVSFDRLFS